MTDYILVKRETLQSAAESLGSFCSDHGWSQQDMDNMDSLWALLAAPCEPVVNCDNCLFHYKDANTQPCRDCVHSGNIEDRYIPKAKS